MTTIKPSQWVNFIWLLVAIAGGYGMIITESPLFIIPTLIWICKAIVIACWKYRFNEDTDTIVERKGVFSVETVEIHYFRIKSIQRKEPFFQRIVGLSTINIITSEPYRKHLQLYAISNGEAWVQYLKDASTYWRNVRGVHETDFHNF
jgi:uncharacterized membrane protein YdbT with pleckstrin-like domain